MNAPLDALFINCGILGLRGFSDFVRATFGETGVDGVRATQTLVTDDLTSTERVMRYALCKSVWPAAPGVKNLDLHRFRCDLNAGLLARNRLVRLERAGWRFDALHFHCQTTAYASLDVMRRIPSIVSIDSTQRPVLQQARSALERGTSGPHVR